jgi:aspartate aminotransferase-like enzyme/GNAT superfamily N-acetyltransferase
VSLVFKVAETPEEFEQIHRLNYRAFVEEIPQHPPNPERRLVDRFHDENTYVICLSGDRVVGMVALRNRRPFSLDAKLPNLDDYLPPGRPVGEVRLLAVEPAYRGGRVLPGLLGHAAEVALRQGYDCGVMSATTRQLKLYRHLGCEPFGPPVGTAEALYQPMLLKLETLRERAALLFQETREREPISFLPGPVPVAAAVRSALATPPRSHRSRAFMDDFQTVRERLRALVSAPHVEVLLGSGTLANDAVAARLAIEREPGIVLSNGEFGERLIDHALRFALEHDPVRLDWGGVFTVQMLREAVDRHPGARWLWAAHHETSTGVLNDLGLLRELCRERGLKLCLDSVSSIGTVPIDLRGVHLASASSGKGLGSFPGLGLVFTDGTPAPVGKTPRAVDLAAYAAADGVPYTTSSNLVAALRAALVRFEGEAPFREIAEDGKTLRRRLVADGFRLIAPEESASPAITTIALPPQVDSARLGDRLEDAGILVSYRSGYLLKRNWIQFAIMGQRRRPTAVATALRTLQAYAADAAENGIA